MGVHRVEVNLALGGVGDHRLGLAQDVVAHVLGQRARALDRGGAKPDHNHARGTGQQAYDG